MTSTRSPALSRPHPPAVVAAPGRAVRRAAGRWHHDLRTGRWSWSPETAALLGLPPGGRPCGELLVHAVHPADRPRAGAALAGAERGRPFSLQVRLCGRHGLAQAAVLIGEPWVDETGRTEAVDGLVAVLSTSPPRPSGDDDRAADLELEVEQLRTAMASRAPIEQAKGILMLLTGCGDRVAFDLLAHISSNSHRKVRDVALAIARSASGQEPLPEDVRALMRDVCPPARTGR
ncbi:ANTAR domain-containing protein [Geodermatophilus marinus]|uniref:ANTAR domain-containing protein n=1 Tax=Geodermatophilus sp. LHW52908 TaxID=2303986 RepID=UPI000E3DE735|nr:ANTAR domain-containing protein [Geodermatophilus sp. LHW52908]RFU22262.1 ANTAR domain-containing protein [Geodermatophilus sp. LHW52908]